MPIRKDISKKGHINFSSQDFTVEGEYNVVYADDPTGKHIPLDLWSYSIYFFEKIQYVKLSKEMVYMDGIRLDKFMAYFVKEKLHLNIEKYVMESTCYGLQQEMQNKHGVHVNWFALYGLCAYIKEIINRRLVVLFKPTIQETLDELAKSDKIASITFDTPSGIKHITDNHLLIDVVRNALKESTDDTYVFDKLCRKVDVYTKEYAQIEFVRYLSRFFHEYFNIDRRKNSYLTSTEQRIICYMLKFFEFTPEVVQESRFRQLASSKYKPIDHFMPLRIPGLFESNIYVYLEFLSYSEWKNGRINPLSRKIVHGRKEIKHINMGEKTDLAELLKVLDGLLN